MTDFVPARRFRVKRGVRDQRQHEDQDAKSNSAVHQEPKGLTVTSNESIASAANLLTTPRKDKIIIKRGPKERSKIKKKNLKCVGWQRNKVISIIS